MSDVKSPLLPTPASGSRRRDESVGHGRPMTVASSTLKVLVGLGVLTLVVFHAGGPGASVLKTLSGNEMGPSTGASWWPLRSSEDIEQWDAPLEEIKDGKYPSMIHWKPCPEAKDLLCARFA